MALSQDRIIAVIRAARAYEKSLDVLGAEGRRIILDIYTASEGEKMDLATALQVWDMATMQSNLASHEDVKALAEEETHFKLMRSRNAAAAIRMRNKRATGSYSGDGYEGPRNKTQSVADMREQRQARTQRPAPTTLDAETRARLEQESEELMRRTQMILENTPPRDAPVQIKVADIEEGLRKRTLKDGTEVLVGEPSARLPEDGEDLGL